MAIFYDRMGKPLDNREASQRILNRFLNWVLDLELLFLTWIGLIPSHFIRLFFYKLEGVKIGKGSRIHIGARFFFPANIEIGEGSIIGDNVFLDGRDKIKIGDHVDIASEVMIYNSEHDVNSDDFHATVATVEIGDYVFIGPRVIILPGVNGFEILKRLKEDPTIAHIPVMMLTNLGQKSDIERGQELGAEEYMVKAQYTPKEIVDRIKQLFAFSGRRRR